MTNKNVIMEMCETGGFILECFDATGDNHNHEFFAKVRVKGTDEIYSATCDRWVREFSSKTCTNWIVRYTYPSATKYEYRKVYKCQHSNFDKVKERKRDAIARKRNKDCEAKIDFLFKKINRNTKKNDIYLSKGYNGVITITFKHSHPVLVSEAFRYLRISSDAKHLFHEYFNDGMTPAMAKKYHEMMLMEKYTGSTNTSLTLANAQVNPTERQVKYLYQKWRKSRSKQEEAPLNCTCPESYPSDYIQPSTSGTKCIPDIVESQASISPIRVQVKSEPETAENAHEQGDPTTDFPLEPIPESLAVGACEINKTTPADTVFCRLCLKPVNTGRMISLTTTTTLDVNYPNKSETFKNKQATDSKQLVTMIRTLIPTFDFGLVYNPIMCYLCNERLELAFKFIEETMESQETIKAYKKQYVRNGEEDLILCADVVKHKSKSSGLALPKKRKRQSNKTTDPTDFYLESCPKVHSGQDYGDGDDMKDDLVETDLLSNILNAEPLRGIKGTEVKIEFDPIGIHRLSQLEVPGSGDSECGTVKSEIIDDGGSCFSPTRFNIIDNQNSDVYNSGVVSGTGEIKLEDT